MFLCQLPAAVPRALDLWFPKDARCILFCYVLVEIMLSFGKLRQTAICIGGSSNAVKRLGTQGLGSPLFFL
jgi:hypothetical protein